LLALSRIGVAILIWASIGRDTPAAAGEFVPLFPGDDLTAMELVGIGPEAVRVVGGEIRLAGKPHGYLATRRSYKHYVLKFEWMYERPGDLESDAGFRGNGGLLVHIQGPPRVWPRCIEVQLQNSSAGALLALGGAKCEGRRGPAPKGVVKPVGQWNQVEVTCHDGSITCAINGVAVSQGTGVSPEGGPIGWQSEGVPIRLRNLRVRSLD
jgi:hypothetical protein